MSAKKQIDFVREKGGSIFKEPVVRLAILLEIANNSKDLNGNRSFSFHLVPGPEASIPEDQVDSIGNVYQVVGSRDLSMHAVDSSNMTRQAIFGEVLSELPIELFVATSPFDEGRSKSSGKPFRFLYTTDSPACHRHSQAHRKMCQERFAPARKGMVRFVTDCRC